MWETIGCSFVALAIVFLWWTTITGIRFYQIEAMKPSEITWLKILIHVVSSVTLSLVVYFWSNYL